MKQSLGLLEVCGLALAISCADIMAKSASITLLALEKTNGSGWMVIKITGDVASVQAAITTGAHSGGYHHRCAFRRTAEWPGGLQGYRQARRRDPARRDTLPLRH